MSIHNIIIQVNDCYETGFPKHAHIINTCIIWDKPLEMDHLVIKGVLWSNKQMALLLLHSIG